MLRIKILTLFPELYPGPLGVSVIGDALQRNLWNLEIFNLRDFALDKHKTIDDTPYGGGSGMVLKADIIGRAIEQITEQKPEDYLMLYPSPRGNLLTQKKIVEFANKVNILLLPGRYEGVDQRILDKYNFVEFSIGDYVLSGGEIATFALIDSMIRTMPFVLGNSDSLKEESFALGGSYENLLEYPLYTRPRIWENLEVPQILLSGDHQKISKWRFAKALDVTKERRSDLWDKFCNSNNGNKNG